MNLVLRESINNYNNTSHVFGKRQIHWWFVICGDESFSEQVNDAWLASNV